MFNARITSVATVFGPNRLTVDDVATAVAERSEARSLPTSYIRRLTGVETVYHRDPEQNASDFAASAARKALAHTATAASSVDLLIFASASQDLLEPATSHIVAANLGLRGTPVMDVKNACNSFLNGVQVANAFIRSGVYRKVLVVSGETPTMAIRWNNRSKKEFMRSFAGFSMSDGGAAMLLEATNDDVGVRDIQLTASSDQWAIGTLGMGGSRAPREPEATYFDMDGGRLHRAFLTLGSDVLAKTLSDTGRTWDSFKAIGMHQISKPYLDVICDSLDVPATQIIQTVATHGNITSLSFAKQLELALETNAVGAGDDFAFIGLGGGISTGLGVFTL